MCVVLCLHVCLDITCIQHPERPERKVSNFLELGLQMAVSGRVAAENETKVLWKSSA